MKKRVSRFIEQEKLFSHKDKIAVGLSGGADSVALLAVLCELGYDCIALHCNFHLRGEESMRDERFVEQWVKTLNIDYRKVDFETESYASEHKISIEMAARELRYNWFSEQLRETGAKHIAIAHHADDVVETFLINLTRGSGIHGLTGIKPKNGNIVRPLLCVSRKEILQYLNKKGLEHVEDSTNKEIVYVRNKFRNNIIPLFESINPSFKNSLLQTISYLKNTEEYVDEKINDARGNVMKQIDDNVWHLFIDQLKKEGNVQLLLFEILQPFGFSSSTIQNITNSIDGESGKLFQSEEYTLQKDRDVLILYKTEKNESVSFDVPANTTIVEVPINLKFKIEDASSVVIEKAKKYCFLDYDKLKFPLQLRRWKQGDSFVPFGMKGKKKLSDYFVDNRFSVYKKSQVWLLTSDNQIVWIIGERSDDRFKITDETKKVLKIEIGQ
ncbi:MAG: tRNA lysidine(34) synthetase TilS [Paludibacteraceae bacterium]|nr:tRNA lysidine(34) synthetase TilS [Paludibacteraceae bacterium]